MKNILSRVFTLFIFTSYFGLVSQASTTYGVLENTPDASTTLGIIRQSRMLSQLLLKREIIGIELIQVSGVTEIEKPESWFGHSALRFVEKNSNPLNDLVVSFEMLILNSAKTYEKGINGGWANYATVTDLATYISRYSVGQSRSIKRMPIPTTPEIINNLKQNTIAIQDLPDLVEDYHFIKNNCATGLLRLLGLSGISTPKVLLELPQQLDSLLRNSMVAYTKPSEIPQFQSVVNHFANEYSKQYPQIKIKSEEILFNQNFQDYLLKSTQDRKIAFLVYFWPNEFDSLKSFRWRLARQFKSALEKNPIASFISEYPQEFYTACTVLDSDCRTARIEKMKSSDLVDWNTLKKAAVRHKNELSRSEQLIITAKKDMQSYLMNPLVLDVVELSKEIGKLL